MSGAEMMMEKEKKSTNSGRGVNRSVRQENRTGIPTSLKERMELSTGLSFDDVRVHYNSDLPARLDALAYTMGNHVEIGPGQEQHLPHELGHVVQQKLGIVRANARHSSGVAMNTDSGLEHQADEIGAGKKVEIVQRKGENVVQRLNIDPAFLHAGEAADTSLQRASGSVIDVSQIVATLINDCSKDAAEKDAAEKDDDSQDVAGTTRNLLQSVLHKKDAILQKPTAICNGLQSTKEALNNARMFVENGVKAAGITNSHLLHATRIINIHLQFAETFVDDALRVAASIDRNLQVIVKYSPTNNDLQFIASRFNFTTQYIKIINDYLQLIIEKIDKAIEEIRKYVPTLPTIPKGSKPHGKYSNKQSKGLRGQDSAADQLANAGYDVEMLEEKQSGNGRGINSLKNPDFLIGRVPFDCYTPEIPTKKTIRQTIRKKTIDQCNRIVLNLENLFAIDDIKADIIRSTGKSGDLKHLKELLAILPNGNIDRWFFREEE